MSKKNSNSKKTESSESSNKPPDTVGLDFSSAISSDGVLDKPFPFNDKIEYRLHIAKSAFDGIISHAVENTKVELCGVLVGYIGKDNLGPYLIVDNYIRGEGADNKGAQVTFTHSTWDFIHTEMEKKYSGKKIVGWYHTHPGFGIFLSSMDKFIHEYFFNQAFQIAMVHDPLSHKEGVFAWVDGKITALSRAWIGDSGKILTQGSVADPSLIPDLEIIPPGKAGKKTEYASTTDRVNTSSESKPNGWYASSGKVSENDDNLLPSGGPWPSILLIFAFLLGMSAAGFFFKVHIQASFREVAQAEIREALSLMATTTCTKADTAGINKILLKVESLIGLNGTDSVVLSAENAFQIRQEIADGRKVLDAIASESDIRVAKIREFLSVRVTEPLTIQERILNLQESLKKVRIIVGKSILDNIKRIQKAQEVEGNDPRFQKMAKEVMDQALEICPELETQCRIEYPQYFQTFPGVASQ